MRQNIVIIIEPEKFVGTTQNSVAAPEPLVSELTKQVSTEAELSPESKENYDEPVYNLGTPLQTDRWIYRIVVSALAFTIVSAIGGAVWLQSNDKPIPEVLIGLGTGALGGLAGLLAPTPSKD